MAKAFYNLFIRLYLLGANVFALFNQKAKLWVDGRKNIFQKIKEALKDDALPRIWIHCASLGEFEQARPVMEKLKTAYPSHKLFLTFFSPSGYEIQKNFKGCDFIFYLPADTTQNAAQFFQIVQPKLILFIKYELWFHYLQEAKKREVPALLVSARFTRDMSFFRWYGGLFRSMLSIFHCIFVQTESSLSLVSTLKINKAVVSGDTRFDRVSELLQESKSPGVIEKFCGSYKVLIAGSTWREDDLVIDHYVNMHTEMRFIIAPHDIGKERIQECKKIYKQSVLYSDYLKDNQSDCHTLIIDNIGLLKHLYRYATVCFVGGAFGGDGIHNVLEASVYSKPVLFGPNHEKFYETFELMNIEAAFEIESALELEETMTELLNNETLYKKACEAAGNYVQANKGATEIIMNYIQENRLLIS